MSNLHPVFEAILGTYTRTVDTEHMTSAVSVAEESRALADLAARPDGWHGWHSRGVTRTLDQALDAVARKEDMRDLMGRPIEGGAK